VAAFRHPRRASSLPAREAAAATPAPQGPREEAASLPVVDWRAVLGAEKMARILAKPEPKQAAAFEKAMRASDPNLVGALRARYPGHA
jgi:hypothetical protein